MNADPLDDASEAEQLERDLGIAAARKKSRNQEFPVTGFCHNCGGAVEPGSRYCDIECATDHLARIRADRRNGQ